MDLLKKKAAEIRLMAFDADGVLTNGGLIFDDNGREAKIFDAKDGQGLVCVQKAGIITVIITASENNSIRLRAKNLGITETYMGIKYKLQILEELMKKYCLTFENISYMGDDLPDICVLEKVGLSCCPADAIEEVKQRCCYISSKEGGKGAIRELCDFVLRCQNIEPLDVLTGSGKCKALQI